MNSKKELEKKYTFKKSYIDNYHDFKKNIVNKKIIPSQVEFQPPPKSTKKICWMECPYCYGLSAEDNGERMSKDRALKILKEIIDGGVKKVIFAGYATDPLNCEYIDDLLELAVKNNLVFGFNTKALKISDRFVSILTNNKLAKESYISLSIDAGSNDTYKKIHNIKSEAKIYDKVLQNVKKIGAIRKNSGQFDLSAAYLVNIESAKVQDYKNFISDFSKAGCNLLRFTFPQPPKDIKTELGVIPTIEEKEFYKNDIREIIANFEDKYCSIIIVDADQDLNIFNKPRTLPCVARYLFPTVGFDGWLYNCSQSSSPNFRTTGLGDLNKNNFWDLYYNYENKNINNYMKICGTNLTNSGCRCDRKEHLVNQGVESSKIFE